MPALGFEAILGPDNESELPPITRRALIIKDQDEARKRQRPAQGVARPHDYLAALCHHCPARTDLRLLAGIDRTDGVDQREASEDVQRSVRSFLQLSYS